MPNTLDSKSAEYLNLLSKLNKEEQEILIERLKQFQESSEKPVDPSSNSLIKTLVGRDYNQKEKLELEIDCLCAYFQRRRQLLEGALTAPEVAKLLGTSRQTPHDRAKARTLLGLLDNGMLRFPVWQFDPEGADGVIDGLPDVLKALQVSDFAKLNWLVRPNPFLDGMTPVEALKKAQKESVLQEALGVEG